MDFHTNIQYFTKPTAWLNSSYILLRTTNVQHDFLKSLAIAPFALSALKLLCDGCF